MKKLQSVATIVLIFISVSCVQEEMKVTVLKKESWIDLMPGTPGYLTVLLELKAEDADSGSVRLSGMKLFWGEKTYRFKNDEIEFNISAFEDDLNISLLARFLPGDKNITSASAELLFVHDNDTINYTVEDIIVEKVY
jgi:hypothetical protein